MKGVVKYARGGEGFVKFQDFEERPLAPNQMKIEVKATGICGSDLHLYHDTINYNIRTPVVLGHEFSGVVVEKGSQAGDGVEIGDRVTAEPSEKLISHEFGVEEWDKAFELAERQQGVKLLLRP